MKNQSETSLKKQLDILEELISMHQKEHQHSEENLQDLYTRLYESLYLLRDYSTDWEAPKKNTIKSKILKSIRYIWRIGANPYIRYHNQFHGVLINLIFVQFTLIQQLANKIDKKASDNDK
ncbi:hypothetical protein U9M73_15105 [Paenibacillus phoenicis]|uniref:Uncharacterized protein n=1 Tax=Paenibacillus phoenicis TaxID=554117 RepID=A0ABU5PN21_9BACL|nr:hypothetical protein [Paenibacillus phoenicis]MEA3571281.1 hypothetical protein [Paenibacillus phoenicis]